MTDDRIYLLYVRECITRIKKYTTSGREAFRTQTIITLAESTQRLSETLKANHAAVNWRSIGRFRNVVIHNYLRIDLNLIWDVIEQDLPDLNDKIEAIWQELGEEL